MCAVIAAVLGFFAFIEFVRAYQVLSELHPWLGWGYLIALGLLVLFLAALYVRSVLTRRRALVPPDRADTRRYGAFLLALARRLDANQNVSFSLRQTLASKAADLEGALKTMSGDDLEREVTSFLSDCVSPCMKELDACAEREVQKCVRDVMIGVTISPWRAADLLVVLYRNVLMVVKVIGTYDVRPAAGAQLRIMGDISKVVFTVNVLNYGSKLAENLASGIPVVGRFIDDIAQGVGAGLLTSMAGHAAMERCSCLKPWEAAEAQAKMGAKAKDFAADLKGIVAEDIIPRLKVRLPQKEVDAEPGRVENLKSAVVRAMDETSGAMDAFIRKPATAAGMTVARGVGGIFAAGAKGIGKGTVAVGRGVSRAANKLLGRLRGLRRKT